VKVTRLGRSRPLVNVTTIGSNPGTSGEVITSTGSNGTTYWGPNVATITADGSNAVQGPFVNFASGSNILFSIASNTLSIHSTGGGAAIAAGSNSTRVREVPTIGSSTTLWSPFDHAHDGIGTITASSSNTLQRGTVNLRPGTGTAFTLTDSDGDGEFDTLSIGVSGTFIASETDIIANGFGAPTHLAFEFESSSLTGLTAHGTPDTENAHTTVAGHYFIADNASGVALCGRSIAIPSYPWTAITKITDASILRNFNAAGLFIGVDPPGALDFLNIGGVNQQSRLERFTNLTTFSSTPANLGNGWRNYPIYIAIRANSSTSFDYFVTHNGYVWSPMVLARNPAITIGIVGILMKSENTTATAAAFDYLRVWSSALTFPGE
jgi:hypothetical protein